MQSFKERKNTISEHFTHQKYTQTQRYM